MPRELTQELFDMGDEELSQELEKSQQELLNLRFQYATHQNSNYAQLRGLKRAVARMKTILRERELAELET